MTKLKGSRGRRWKSTPAEARVGRKKGMISSAQKKAKGVRGS